MGDGRIFQGERVRVAIELSSHFAVIAWLDRAIQYAVAYLLITNASGMLDRPLQCAIAHKAGDNSLGS